MNISFKALTRCRGCCEENSGSNCCAIIVRELLFGYVCFPVQKDAPVRKKEWER